MVLRAPPLLAAYGTVQPFSTQALGVDAHSIASAASGSSVQSSITTLHANTIVCAVVFSYKATSGSATQSVVETGNKLTFVKRTFITNAGGANEMNMEIWWAVARAVGTYTVKASWAAAQVAAVINVFAVNGIFNELAPWDTGSGLPSATFFNNGSSLSTYGSNAFTPHDPKVFMFAACGTIDQGVALSLGSVDSLTANTLDSARTANSFGFLNEWGASSSLTGITSCNMNGNQHFFVGIADCMAG